MLLAWPRPPSTGSCASAAYRRLRAMLLIMLAAQTVLNGLGTVMG